MTPALLPLILTLALDPADGPPPPPDPAAVAAIAAAARAPRTPAVLHAAAHADLVRLTRDPRTGRDPLFALCQRYFSLHAYQPGEYAEAVRALKFEMNSVSWAPSFGDVHSVPGWPELARIDLRDFGLDKFSRYSRLMKLRQIGVFFPTARGCAVLDPWELLADADPYFKVSQTRRDGTVFRGWIDPVVELQARTLTQSRGFVVAAHSAIPKLLTERQDGGFYSDFLMLPANVGDLFKTLGTDPKFAAQFFARYGAAVIESDVAYHNRELQSFPIAVGGDGARGWITLDFAQDNVADKNVLESLAGTGKFDGGEVIWPLNNGLHAYYLINAQGNQVNVVPQAIAEDRRKAKLSRQQSVISAYKCIDCHAEHGGFISAHDEIAPMLARDDSLKVLVTKDAYKGADFALGVKSYYRGDFEARIAAQSASYRQRVADCIGLDDGETPEALGQRLGNMVVRHVERWTWDLVSPEQAAREMGLPLETAQGWWALAGVDPKVGKRGNQKLNSQFGFLSAGRPVRRAAWDEVYKDAMTAVRWPWELQEKGH